MLVPVSCPECSVVIDFPEEHLGRKIRCGQCGETFVAAEIKPKSRGSMTQLPKSKSSTAVPKRRPDEDDEYEEEEDDYDRPRRKSKKKAKQGNPALLFGLIGGGVMLLCLGVGIFFIVKSRANNNAPPMAMGPNVAPNGMPNIAPGRLPKGPSDPLRPNTKVGGLEPLPDKQPPFAVGAEPITIWNAKIGAGGGRPGFGPPRMGGKTLTFDFAKNPAYKGDVPQQIIIVIRKADGSKEKFETSIASGPFGNLFGGKSGEVEVSLSAGGPGPFGGGFPNLGAGCQLYITRQGASTARGGPFGPHEEGERMTNVIDLKVE